MSSSGFGSGAKGGAVYNGPSPSAAQGTTYGTTVKTAEGTVYGSPAPGGTVYNGSAPGGIPARPASGPTKTAPSGGSARGAGIFFLIAGFTAINTVLMFVGIRFGIGLSTTALDDLSLPQMLVLNLVGAGIFALLGVFARSGSKPVFLIGMLLYGGDLVVLVLNNPGLHIISIIIHGLFLFYLFNAFRQLA